MAKPKKIVDQVEVDKTVDEFTEEEANQVLAEDTAEVDLLQKRLWKGNLVKLVNDKGDVKVQDNPERIKELEAAGWVRA